MFSHHFQYEFEISYIHSHVDIPVGSYASVIFWILVIVVFVVARCQNILCPLPRRWRLARRLRHLFAHVRISFVLFCFVLFCFVLFCDVM